MGYYVRLLSPSEKVIYFSEIKLEVESIKLTAGNDHEWEDISISGPSDLPIAILSRISIGSSGQGNDVTNKLKDGIGGASPTGAREWIRKYLSTVKTIYAFQLLTENLTTDAEWRTLGQVQNLLKDNLGGIIQSDHEGYFNESGDYILWQMYAGAGGSIPAATLDENGEWISFQLKLLDEKAVERFKRGEKPQKGFFDVFFNNRK
jgi:hypothetical protein